MVTAGAGLAGLFGGKGIGIVVALVAISAAGSATAAGMIWHPGGVPVRGDSGFVGSMACEVHQMSGSLQGSFSGTATCQASMSGGMMTGGTMNGQMTPSFSCSVSGSKGMSGTPVSCSMQGTYSMGNGMMNMTGNMSGSFHGMMGPQNNNLTGTMPCQMTMSGSGMNYNGGMGNGGMMYGGTGAPNGYKGGQMSLKMTWAIPTGGEDIS